LPAILLDAWQSSNRLKLLKNKEEEVAMRTVTLASLFVLAAGTAHAQSLPSEGNLEVTYTATNNNVLKPMPIAGGKQFVVNNLSMTAVNATGNAVLDNMGGRCQFTNITDSAAKTSETQGWCTYADKDGDQIFEHCDLPKGCTLNGGTGKFQGIQADLQITGAPIKGTYEGVYQIIGTKKGTYRISKKL
jgi:hypothetical protein